MPATASGTRALNPPDDGGEEPARHKAERYVWALFLASTYEVLPLAYPKGGDMRIIAFIIEDPVICEILGDQREPTALPSLAPARGPLLWELPAARQTEREAGPHSQPAPDDEYTKPTSVASRGFSQSGDWGLS